MSDFPLLNIVDLVKHYPGVHAVNGISFELPSGGVLALVGPSGAGKTTMFNLIPRFYDPGEGAIRLDGHDLREVTQASLRAQIGIVEDNVYSLDGQVMNRSGDAGAEVSVPVELIGEEGQVVSSEVLTVTLPDGGEAEAFQLQVQVEEPVAGFQYGQAGMAGGS